MYSGALLTHKTAMAWPLNVRENLTCDVDIALKDGLKNAGREGPYITGKSVHYCLHIHHV